MFRTILVATDLTAQSNAALRTTRGLAEAFGSRILVAHVVPMSPELKRWRSEVFVDDMTAYNRVLRRQVTAAEAELDRQVSTAGLTSTRGVRTVVRTGNAAPVLAGLVDELDANLVVVARGRGGKLGPVAEQLVRLVGRTVLVAPVRGVRAAGLTRAAKPGQRRGQGRPAT